MATRSMPFWPRPATTSGSSWPGSGLCAPFSGRLSWSGITRAAPLPHPPEHANSLFHRRLALAMLLRPARVDVLLRRLVGLPRDRRIAVLDRLVLFAAVALHGRRHEGGVDDLAAHGQVAPALQMGIEGLEQRLDQPRLRELLAIQPDRLGVGDPIREAQSQEAHEREPVADLILELVIGEIVERLQNQRLEDDD